MHDIWADMQGSCFYYYALFGIPTQPSIRMRNKANPLQSLALAHLFRKHFRFSLPDVLPQDFSPYQLLLLMYSIKTHTSARSPLSGIWPSR
jgi:hypothetical protein